LLNFCVQRAMNYVRNRLSLCHWEAHWSISTKDMQFNRIYGYITMKGIHDINVGLLGAKVKQKSQMTVFQEMGIESNLPQPNLMILVSFSSAEDALSNGIKIFLKNTFRSQCTENLPFRFFWDTRYKPSIRSNKQTTQYYTIMYAVSTVIWIWGEEHKKYIYKALAVGTWGLPREKETVIKYWGFFQKVAIWSVCK